MLLLLNKHEYNVNVVWTENPTQTFTLNYDGSITSSGKTYIRFTHDLRRFIHEK